MDITQCDWNGCNHTFIKKKVEHRFCSDKCRKKSHRSKKGKPLLPAFIAKKSCTPCGITKKRQISQPTLVQMPQTTIQANAAGTNYRVGFAIAGMGIGLYNKMGFQSTAILTGLGFLFGREMDRNNRAAIQPIVINQVPAASLPSPNVSAPTPPPRRKRIISGREYRAAHVESIGLKGEYLYLIGDPAPGFYMLLTGLPGHGKSTFAVKFSEYFYNNHGRVLYLASEQPGINKPLQDLLNRFSGSFDIDTRPTGKPSEIIQDAKGYDLLVLDSVNNMRMAPDDVNKIRKALPKLSIVAIMQSTKDGGFKGSQEFLHDCDIRIDCQRPHAKQLKSRYAPPSQILNFKPQE